MIPTPVQDTGNPLLDLLRCCVVRIDDTHRGFRGTGFFVAHGVVVTAAHVLHGCTDVRLVWGEKTLGVASVDARPALDEVGDPGRYPLPDLAVMHLGDNVPDHPVVRLATELPIAGADADDLHVAAFTCGEHAADAITFSGIATTYEAPVGEGAFTLLKLRDGQVLTGYSGAPLLNLRTGDVVGVVESTRGTQTALGGFGVPVRALGDAFPALLEQNVAACAADRRWADAAEAEAVAHAMRRGVRARLPLDAPTVDIPWSPEHDSAADALRPRRALVPFTGRRELLEDIARWRDSAEPVSVWFVTGARGFGKTRLAVEACRQAQAAGWTAGLLSSDAAGEEFGEWPGRLFVAVDYAETRAPELVARLLTDAMPRSPRRLRLLLLVRRDVPRRTLEAELNPNRNEIVAALLRRGSYVLLSGRDQAIDRLALLDAGTTTFGTAAPVPTRRRPTLGAAHFGRPLYVLVAAYLAARDGGIDVDALSEDDLLRSLLDEHEAGYWMRWTTRRGMTFDAADQRRAVALATLLGAQDEDEALAVVGLLPSVSADPERRLAIARWLACLYNPAGIREPLTIWPLEPDRLAEVLVGDVLREQPALLQAALDTASDGQLARLLTVVARVAATDDALRAHARDILNPRLLNLFQRAFTADGTLLVALAAATGAVRPAAGAREVADALPDVLPVGLRLLAAEITEMAAAAVAEPTDEDSRAGAGHLLNTLANRLADAGRRDGAAAVWDAALLEWQAAPWVIGVLLLSRGRWHGAAGHIEVAARDLLTAVDHLERAGDIARRGEARELLRRLVGVDADAVGRAASGRDLPAWLAYPDAVERLGETLVAWVRTTTWDASAEFLSSHPALLTQEGEATIERLIDANPHADELQLHLRLLRVARADGVAVAYEQLQTEVRTAHLLSVLDAWITTPSWAASRDFAVERAGDLFDDAVSHLLADLCDQHPRDPDLRAHRGLLAIARADGVDAAYALRDDRTARQDAIDAAARAGACDRLLALSRLDSGLATGDPEAHYGLALAATLAGEGAEATAAMHDCVAHAAPYQRVDFVRRLQAEALDRPTLADQLAGLQQLVTAGGDA